MTTKSRVKHYLISLPLDGYGATMHCYLMSNDPSHVDGAYKRLLHEAERVVGEINAPVLLSTELTPDGMAEVRKVLTELHPEDCAKTFREAHDFHISIWGMAQDAPHNRTLTKMH